MKTKISSKKISKFVSSILVAFVGVGLIAPLQVRAVMLVIIGTVDIHGNASVTPHDTEPTVEHTLTISGASVFDASGNLNGLENTPVSFKQIMWTGSGPSTVLAGGQVTSFWQAGLFSFDLKNLDVDTFDSDTLILAADGTLHVPGRGPLRAAFELESDSGSAENFSYPNSDSHTFALSTGLVTAPEGGSTLGLLVLGLVAVERLRRKIAALQNR